jgi:putative MATE family efflux protein
VNHRYDILNEPIPRLLRELAVPTSVGFFFNTMFNVVDTFYGGLVSTQALAALSLSFPIFFLIFSIGSGISSGATALIGHALGAGNKDEARRYAVQTISFGLVHGLLITLLGLAAAPALFSFLGATGDYLRMALAYMNAIFAGGVFFIVNFVLNAILNATGDTRSFRNFLIFGFFLNLLLDPWFLFGGFGIPSCGLAGIAWATVVVQALGNGYLLTRVAKTGLLHGFSWRGLLPQRRPYLELARQGFPSSLNMATVALGIFIITWFIGRFGKDAVAAYGIATRIEQVALLPVMGMNFAILAVVAQNSGAQRLERVRETVTTALKAGVGLMSVGTVAVFLGAGLLMQLFTKAPVVVAIGTSYLHIESFVFAAYVILYASISALQGLKKPVFALWIGLFRQIIAPLPVFYLLANYVGWGLTGIWWGIFLVTWTAACIALLFIRHTLWVLLRDGDSRQWLKHDL